MPAAKRLYDDGVHYVRAATKKDKHPMRFVVCAHTAADTKLNRHVPSLEEGVALCERMTPLAIEKSENDERLAEQFRIEQDTKATDEYDEAHPIQPDAKSEEKDAGPPKFSTYHFTCRSANPAAQVWQCTSLPGEKKTPGRKRSGRASPNASKFDHAKGECAVLVGPEPVRNADGSVRVFKTYYVAEEYAQNLYDEAYERGEVIEWNERNVVVDRLTDVEICFDPTESYHMPFYLMIRKGGYRKPVYKDALPSKNVVNAKNADGSRFVPTTEDEKEGHEFNRKLDRMFIEEFKTPRLSTAVARFRTIWEAEEKALHLERTYCGNGDLYP